MSAAASTAATAPLSQRLSAAKQDLETLKQRVDSKKSSLTNGGLASVPGTRRFLGPALTRRKTLSGHFGKVYAMSWAHTDNTIISAGQDSKLILWNAAREVKLDAVPLKTTWAMACGFDPTDSLVAWGGMDNTCTIVPARTPSETTRRKELHGHDGYVSGVRFVTKDSILTSSGDSTCILWDTNKCTSIRKFTDHAADVLALCPSPTDENVFCSCSIDSTAKVWDIRTGKCVQTFVGHDGDVNCVDFLPSGQSFATGGDDAAVFLFDLRSCARINEMVKEDTIVTQVSSVGFSKSGRVLFAGHDDCNVYGWDSLLESASNPIYTMGGHTYRVSCLGMNATGEALCTGSWDTDLVIWA